MAKDEASKIRLSGKERLAIFTDLATMLNAGIPILEAVESLLIDSKGNSKKVLTHIRASLYNGEPMSRSMEQMPKAFDAINVNLVRAAETGGTLETTLKDIVVASKKEMAFSDQLRSTMIYPLFVCIVFSGIVILMLTFVIPRISEVFSSLNVKMPFVTRVMIKVSNGFIHHWLVIVLGIVLFIVCLVLIIRANKHRIVRLLLSIPVFKKLGINIDLTRFTRSFGLLMQAGVPIIESLKLSENVVQNKAISEVIKQMSVDIEAGKDMATSLRGPKSPIPLIMSRSLKTAETSGTLNETLVNLNEYFEGQVNESLKVLSSLIEPILIIVVGVMVGLLMITIIAPIYNMISQINSVSNPTPK